MAYTLANFDRQVRVPANLGRAALFGRPYYLSKALYCGRERPTATSCVLIGGALATAERSTAACCRLF